MSRISAESFLSLIRQSGLVEGDRLEREVDELQDEGTNVSDSTALANSFIERELLTQWQAEKLLKGKHKGFSLGKYRLMKLLGKGGMSSVYLAEHLLMRRRCAIKVLPIKRVTDTSYLARFHREAQAVASLDHPNIVRAYDIDHEVEGDKEIHFLVMEYVDGQSLQDQVKEQGPLSLDDAAEYFRQAAKGLENAHQNGLIHRDVKPGNLLIDRTETVKVLDLGLAKLSDPTEDNSLTLTHDEKVLGTADYLAPEQALDSHLVDRRADIYGLGCTAYFALTGHPPFRDGTLAQRLMWHQTKEPPPLSESRPEVGETQRGRALADIIGRMMAKKPDDRSQTMAEVVDELQNWLEMYATQEWRKQHPHVFSSASGKSDSSVVPVAQAVPVAAAASTAAASGTTSTVSEAPAAATSSQAGVSAGSHGGASSPAATERAGQALPAQAGQGQAGKAQALTAQPGSGAAESASQDTAASSQETGAPQQSETPDPAPTNASQEPPPVAPAAEAAPSSHGSPQADTGAPADESDDPGFGAFLAQLDGNEAPQAAAPDVPQINTEGSGSSSGQSAAEPVAASEPAAAAGEQGSPGAEAPEATPVSPETPPPAAAAASPPAGVVPPAAPVHPAAPESAGTGTPTSPAAPEAAPADTPATDTPPAATPVGDSPPAAPAPPASTAAAAPVEPASASTDTPAAATDQAGATQDSPPHASSPEDARPFAAPAAAGTSPDQTNSQTPAAPEQPAAFDFGQPAEANQPATDAAQPAFPAPDQGGDAPGTPPQQEQAPVFPGVPAEAPDQNQTGWTAQPSFETSQQPPDAGAAPQEVPVFANPDQPFPAADAAGGPQFGGPQGFPSIDPGHAASSGAAGTVAPAAAPPPASAAGSRSQKKPPIPMIAGIVVGVLALGAGGYFAFSGGSDDKADTKTAGSDASGSAGGGSTSGTAASASTAASSTGFLGNKIHVGPDGDFSTITAALDYLKKYKSRYDSGISRRQSAEVEVVGGETYNERIAVDNSDDAYPQGIHIVSTGVSPAKLSPSGSSPVISLHGIENFHVTGFDVDASGRDVAIEMSGYISRTQLSQLNVTGFSKTGIVLRGAAGFSNDEIVLKEVDLRGSGRISAGIHFAPGDVSTGRVKVLNCRMFGPQDAGMLFDTDVTYVETRENIIAEAGVGIAVRGGPLTLQDVKIFNTTFYKCSEAGILLEQMPPPGGGLAGSTTFNIRRNLFAQLGGPEMVVQENYDDKKFDQFFSTAGGGVVQNWSDRQQPADISKGERDIIARENQRVPEIQFAVTDSTSPDFLKLKPGTPYARVGGRKSDLKPYVGARPPKK